MNRSEKAALLQSAIAAFGRGVGNLACVVAACLLVVMSVILFLQVTYRYVLRLPLPWSEEAARFCLIWFAMLSACVAGQKGLHFAVRWATSALSIRLRDVLGTVVLAFGASLLAFVGWEGVEYLSIVEPLTATATEIRLVWIYAAVPTGCFALVFIYLAELGDALLAPLTGERLGTWHKSEAAALRELLAGEE